MRPEKIGEIDEVVVKILNLSIEPNTPILIGEGNLQHMKDKHPEDFEKYGGKIAEILKFPDYLAKHPKKDSIEYIKIFYDEDTNDHVLVAVRATHAGIYFARTMFVMGKEKVQRYEEKGALHPTEINKKP